MNTQKVINNSRIVSALGSGIKHGQQYSIKLNQTPCDYEIFVFFDSNCNNCYKYIIFWKLLKSQLAARLCCEKTMS